MTTRKRKLDSSQMKKVCPSHDQLLKAGVTEAAARKLADKEICESEIDRLLDTLKIKDERNRMIMSSFLSDMEDLEDLCHPDSKVLNDSVHGHIVLHPLCMAIIDTPQFQRLRHLKQLSMAYYVYPGASHNRFEHCLGVGHLAGVLASALKERQPKLGITNRDILCIQIAGLCHDLGHGPFSHLFDQQFIGLVKPGTKWKHEQSSVWMFDYLVEANNLKGVFEKYGLAEVHRIFIKELIWSKTAAMPPDEDGNITMRYGNDKAFLYEIVANSRNGVDVDKWDYFKRDGHHLGITVTFDHSRFIRFARVVDVKGKKEICIRKKEYFNLFGMFQTRFSLHRQAYQHRVAQAINMMMAEALQAANNYIFIPGDDGKKCKMSDCIEEKNIDALANLTDHVFHDILTKEAGELAKAKEILRNIQRKMRDCIKGEDIDALTNLIDHVFHILKIEAKELAKAKEILDNIKCKMPGPIESEDTDALAKLINDVINNILTSKAEEEEVQELAKAKEILRNIQRRKLYKFVVESAPICDVFLIKECKNPDKIKQEILGKLDMKDREAHGLQTRLLVQMTHLDMGSKYDNPNDKMNFYTKDNPDKAEKLDPKDISTLLPHTHFKEMLVRVYLRPPLDEDETCNNLLKTAFTNWCEEKQLQ